MQALGVLSSFQPFFVRQMIQHKVYTISVYSRVVRKSAAEVNHISQYLSLELLVSHQRMMQT